MSRLVFSASGFVLVGLKIIIIIITLCDCVETRSHYDVVTVQ